MLLSNHLKQVSKNSDFFYLIIGSYNFKNRQMNNMPIERLFVKNPQYWSPVRTLSWSTFPQTRSLKQYAPELISSGVGWVFISAWIVSQASVRVLKTVAGLIKLGIHAPLGSLKRPLIHEIMIWIIAFTRSHVLSVTTLRRIPTRSFNPFGVVIVTLL